jgi:hypothetical protein
MINEALDDITLAIVDIFENTTELEDVLLVLENQPSAEEPTDAVWCRLSNRPAYQRQIELGSNPKFELLGSTIIQVFVPLEAGEAIGFDVLSAVDSQIKRWRSTDKKMKVYESQFQSVPARKDDAYFQINYTILWSRKG